MIPGLGSAGLTLFWVLGAAATAIATPPATATAPGTAPASAPAAAPATATAPAPAAVPATGAAQAPAPAAATAPASSSISTDGAAQQAFRAGVDAARQEQWVDARISFEKAYQLSPRPVVLINLAGAQARTGRLTEAAKNYRLILGDESSAETASFRRAAAEVLPALDARIPRVRLRHSGLSPDDVIQIDGQTVQTEALATGLPLDPGEHTLIVKHLGAERARVLFGLTERELRYITLPLPPLVQRASSPGVAAGLESSERDGQPGTHAETGRSWWRSPWTWTVVAVVLAGASAGTYVLVNRHGDQQQFTGNIPPGSLVVH